MAATIIQFPQQQSVAFMNLTQLVELASDNLMVEGYAKLMEDCYRKSEFRPGEFETLQEQIRKNAWKMQNRKRNLQWLQRNQGCIATLRRWEIRNRIARSR